MSVVYPPYMPDDKSLIERLRTCRTFAYTDVMEKAASS